MTIEKILIAWGFLMLFILIIGIVIKRIDRVKTVYNLGKLDFNEWYRENKDEILNKIEKKGIKTGFCLEAAIDEEYELYLLH